MVKAYLKFVGEKVFGLISTSNSLIDRSGRYGITGCGERISLWDLRRQVFFRSMFEEDCQSEVTTLSLTKEGELLASGYSDGSIRIWNMNDYSLVSVFNGHRGAVTSLCFNQLGSLLVSGARDTDIIVWDIITESGLFRLRGHRDQVTSVKLLEKSNHIVSSSKDGLIKIWDSETQHCVQTIVGHRNPVWGIDVNPDETRLASCTSDNQIRIWRIPRNEQQSAFGYRVNVPMNSNALISTNEIGDDTPDTEETTLDLNKLSSDEQVAVYYGSIQLKSDSYSSVRFDPTNRILAAQSTGKFIDLFKITHYDKIKMTEDVSVEEELRHKQTLKMSSKVRFFSFGSETYWNKIIVTLAGNSLEVFDIKSEDGGFQSTCTLDQYGHRSDIRALTLSSNDSMVISTSSESIKVWNVKTLNCILTLPCDYGLCSVFAPGNLHILVGTKRGTIEIFELSSSEHIGTIKAHEGSVWSIALTPDQRGLVSGGADKSVKFWDFELEDKKLSLSLSQTMKMESDVMALKYSSNFKVLAISLLDNTVKIFYADTLKFHLSLYGHKLPVMCLDISDDSALIVTGSADKNIKIWGLDYGDCHKSLFAHDDSIMQIAFIPKTHHFVSVSKDKRIKYWDADKFEHIQTIEAHHGEVWALAMGSVGDFFITGSHDRSMRTFKQTDTPLFIESERQQALEKEWESTLEEDLQSQNRIRTTEMLQENLSAGKKTVETIKQGEDILDAIQMCWTEKLKLEDYEKEKLKSLQKGHKKKQGGDDLEDDGMLVDSGFGEFQPNILLLGLSHSEYLWKRLNRVRPSDLEEALLVLPFSTIRALFGYFIEWLQEPNKSPEFIFKCSFFLIQTHMNQLSVSKDHVHLLQTLNTTIKSRLKSEKEKIGLNRSAMGYIKREIEINNQFKFFDPSNLPNQDSNKTKSKKRSRK
ncbi:WD40 repeat-containing protein [Tieghemostelium lacteum]|uniref:WD40 repeat-containing protein n=1 Tax=Tieghemostelium lacteum TaxID=361077 RepID=A0A151Z866_TIELA|nr:WD40 repeat-containing protein [Tieghemostelium lacteum]|eukprot:KYQ90125.1 WD40 repeat-containing protein [Tieghemostelium lacteum]